MAVAKGKEDFVLFEDMEEAILSKGKVAVITCDKDLGGSNAGKVRWHLRSLFIHPSLHPSIADTIAMAKVI